MSTQIIVDNKSSHSLHLVRPHHRKLDCNRGCEYSLKLSISASHPTLYKLKKEGHVIAHIWINHTGLITEVKNLSEHFTVSFINKHHTQRPMIHGYGLTGLDVGDWLDGYLNAIYSEGDLQVLSIRELHC